METVLGVPLSEGEQLFYAYEIDMQKKRLIGSLVGVELHLVLSGGRMEKMNIEQQEGPNLGPVLATGLVKGWDSLVAIESAPAARTVSKL